MPEIVINAKLNTSELKPGTKEFNSAVNSLGASVTKVGKQMNSAFSQYTQTTKQLITNTQKAGESVSELQNALKRGSGKTPMAQAADDAKRAAEGVRQVNKELREQAETTAKTPRQSGAGDIQDAAHAYRELTDNARESQKALDEAYQALLRNAATTDADAFSSGALSADEIEETLDAADALKILAQAESDAASEIGKAQALYDSFGESVKLSYEDLRNAGASTTYGRDAQSYLAAIQGEQAGVTEETMDTASAARNVLDISGMISQQIMEIEQKYQGIIDKITEVETATRELQAATEAENRGYDHTTSQEEYQAQLEMVQNIGNRLSDLIDKKQQLSRVGVNKDSSQWKVLQDNIDQTKEELQEANAELARMREGGIETASVVERFGKIGKPQGWDDMLRVSTMLSGSLQNVERAAETALYSIAHPAESIDRALGNVISRVGQAVSAFARMAGNAAVSFLKRIASEAKNAAVALARLAANAVSSGLKKIGAGAAYAVKGLLGLNKQSKRANGGLATSLKNILKYAFGIRSLFFLFRRLRAAISEGFGELKRQNPEVKASLDSLSKALSGLKGSLAAAFAPILTAVAPMLTTLINMLTTAINTIGAFFAALTGHSTVARSIGAIGSSAKGSSSSVKKLKRELAGFDELNILNGKDSGGGGGGGSGSGLAYENVPIDEGIKNFVDRLKALWEAADYEGVGNYIASFINKGFEVARDFISWDNVQGTVEDAVAKIAGVFNGLIDPENGIDFELIGNTFGAGVDTIIRSFNLLSAAVKWANIGVGIANFFNGFIEIIDPDELSTALINAINIPLEALKGFVANFKWGEAATKFTATVNQLVNKFDGRDFGRTLADAIHKVFRTIKSIVGGFQWGTAGQKFIDTVNAFFSNKDMFTEGAGILNETVKGILEFADSALGGFDADTAASNLKAALEEIEWDDIANKAWNLFKTAVKKLGSFLTVLFGGEVEPDASSTVDAVEQMWRRHSGQGASVDISEDSFGQMVTKLSHHVLLAIKSAFESIPWDEWGATIHDKIVSIDWNQIALDIWDAITTALSGIEGFIYTLLFGKDYKSNAIYKMLTLGLNEWSEGVREFENTIDEAAEAAKEFEGVNRGAVNWVSELLKGNVDNGVGGTVDVWQGLREGNFFNKQDDATKQAIAETIGATMEGGVQAAIDSLKEKGFDTSGIDLTDVGTTAADSMVDGMDNAIEENQADLESAGEDIVTYLAGGVERKAEISSPSKLFYDYGKYMVDGLINGLNTLKSALDGVWKDLPAWAQNLLNGGTMQLALNLGGGNGDNGGAASDETKTQKKQIKEEKKLTKALREKQKPQEVEVDYQGAGFDTSGDKPSLDVGVKFVPDGEDEPPADGASGLLGWLTELFGPGIEVIANVFAKLIGKEPGSLNISDIFDALVTVWALLTGKDPKSVSIASIFGTVLGVLAALTGKQTGSGVFATLGALFGTVFGVKSGLTGTTNGGAGWKLTLGGLFGTLFGVKSGLSGTTNGGSGWKLTLGGLFGTLLGVKSGLSGTTNGGSGWKLTLGGLFGTLLGIKSGLSGATTGNAGWKTTIGALFGTLLGVKSGLSGTTNGGSGWKLTLGGLFGTLLGVKSGLSGTTGGGEGWKTTLGGLFGTILGIKSGLSGTTSGGEGWKTTLGGLFGTLLGVKSGLSGATTGNAGWKTTLSGLFGTLLGVKSGLSDTTSGGEGWKKTLGGLFGTLLGVKSGLASTTSGGEGWKKTLGDLFGTKFGVKAGLTGKADGSKSLTDIFGSQINMPVKLVKPGGGDTKWKFTTNGMNVELSALGGIINSAGKLTRFANGGSIMRNGRASWWNSVNKYAAGTTRAHGTVFVAGEAGPEIMGHVNGRTEILNKSQLADALYGAVVSGMGQAVNALGKYLANHMTTCTNAIVTTIGANAQLSAVRGLDYYAPAMATGTVMPYEVTAQIARSTQELKTTLDENNEDLIQAMVSAIGSASMQIVTAIQQQMMRGGNGVSAQQVLNSINQRTLMFGSNPLKGV